MLFSLARANIGHQWKLFLAAISVLTLSGCLIYVAIGISLENSRALSAEERQLDVDFFIQSTTKRNKRAIAFDSNLLYFVETIEGVERAEPLLRKRGYGDFTLNGKSKRISFKMLHNDLDHLDVPRPFDDTVRNALKTPGSIILARSIANKENLKVGDILQGRGTTRDAKLVGILGGELGRENILGNNLNNFTTLETAHVLGMVHRMPQMGERITTLRIKLSDSIDKLEFRPVLDSMLETKGLKTLLPNEYGNSLSWDFILENKAFQGFLVVAVFAIIIPLFIVVQTLRSAIMAQNVQFATMRALGIPSRHLVSVAMEQALWVGVLGAALSYCAMLAINWQLFERDIFMYLPADIVWKVSVAIIAASLLAGLISLFAIFKTKPQELLR